MAFRFFIDETNEYRKLKLYIYWRWLLVQVNPASLEDPLKYL